MRRNEINVNRKESLQFWLLVAASCVAMTGLLLTLPAKTVQANALLSRPSAVAQPASPAASPTPVLTEPRQAGRKMPANVFHGVASWYGSVFDGRLTASGERFNMYAMTACHPTLPFGTWVRVVNTRNHRSVVVRITDRGLLYNGRVIDLSYAAAEKLDMTKTGLARVTIQVLPRGNPASNQ
jgi:peptidoglycan lytic transglycosylase